MTPDPVFIARNDDGRFAVSLPPAERGLLNDLIGQLRDLLVHSPDDALLQRLFPPAYAGDDQAEMEGEYRRLMGDDLLSGRLNALEVLELTLEADELEEQQAMAWVTALNDMRLVIGTRLDIDEDGEPPSLDDPDAWLYGVYHFLTALVGLFVEAMAGWGEEDLPRSTYDPFAD
jgi:hypothetical protein